MPTLFYSPYQTPPPAPTYRPQAPATQFGGTGTPQPGTVPQLQPQPAPGPGTTQYVPPPTTPGALGVGGLYRTPSGGLEQRLPNQAPVPPSAPNTVQPGQPAPWQRIPGSGVGVSPPTRPPGSYILRDSNPVKYPRPVGTTRQPQTQNPTQQSAFASGGGFGGAQGGMGGGGTVLGSSTGSPGFYGGGFAPASGLGGSLYPSLVSLYR